MNNVFRNTSDVAKVNAEYFEMLKRQAQGHKLQRARFCLHRDNNDPVHEMVIALTDKCQFPPHRHPHKQESIHIVDGELDVTLFNEDGTTREVIHLRRDTTFAYRLCEPIFHTISARSPTAIYYETTSGPWSPEDTELAPWQTLDEVPFA